MSTAHSPTSNPDINQSFSSIIKIPAFQLPAFMRSNNNCQCWTHARYTNYLNLNSNYEEKSLFSIYTNRLLNYKKSFSKNEQLTSTNKPIANTFRTFDELGFELRQMGLDECNVIIGIDFTASNEWKGRRTFNSQSLHRTLGSRVFNPYQKVVSILGTVLKNLKAKIYVYGFGDLTTKNESVFTFSDNENQPFRTFDEIFLRYNKIVKDVHLSGPTSFAPIIRKSINIIKQNSNKYHILFIIADGEVTGVDEIETTEAIQEASNYPLSIICIGVGDGPWDNMVKYDDLLMDRKFDNFQFVDYHKCVRNNDKEADLQFALNALMEVPEQFKIMKKFGYLH